MRDCFGLLDLWVALGADTKYKYMSTFILADNWHIWHMTINIITMDFGSLVF